MGVGCGQLQIIDLSLCRQVTDIGISALGVGCDHLQRINFLHCSDVTYACLLSFCFNCLISVEKII